ncbi:hypothetical protein ABK040_001894 [Willaertia magna]
MQSNNKHNRQLANFFNDDWIDHFFVNPWAFSLQNRDDDRLLKEFKPRTDVSETANEVKVVCNVPGMKKEDIKIDVDEQHRTLTISGEVKKEKKEENETYHCVERSVGSFSRSVYLPKNVDLDGIKANLEHGVLRVNIPKKTLERKTRSVNID